MPQGREAKLPDPPVDEWTALEALPEDEEISEEPSEETVEPEPRSIVIFIQTDFSRVPDRVLGQMKFNYLADEIIEMLSPHDRVAVLSHDSQLKFRRDFTFDRESIRKAVRESLYIDTPPPPGRATDGSSLADLLDRPAMKGRACRARCSASPTAPSGRRPEDDHPGRLGHRRAAGTVRRPAEAGVVHRREDSRSRSCSGDLVDTGLQAQLMAASRPRPRPPAGCTRLRISAGRPSAAWKARCRPRRPSPAHRRFAEAGNIRSTSASTVRHPRRRRRSSR